VPGTTAGGFGELLRRLRNAAGLTQEELAQNAGLSPRSISDLERGVNQTARRDTARLLAGALGLEGAARAEFEAVAQGRAAAVRPDQAAPARPGPAAPTRTLPRDVASFTGREAELTMLSEAVTGAARQGGDRGGIVSIHAIGGMAGVGKTTLAVHVAHRLADRFPDGQVFLPLHAHTPGQRPVDPMDALASLLLMAGVPPAQIPGSLEGRMARWRDHLADKLLLLVLDDAAGHEQVRPLLPGSGGSMVLVTSRRHLTALDDITAVSLDVLPPDRAAELLTRLADRPGLRPDDGALAEITRLCGCLPLAIGMLARQLHHHPAWSAADLAADLAEARDRLELMRAENLSVAAAFDLSYADLAPDQQVLFRRLGLHPGPDVDAYAAAALTQAGLARSRRQLDGLYDHYLLAEPARGRYRLHDLLREHARALADTDPPGDREQATGRLLDYYQYSAELADGQLSPGRTGTATTVAAPAAAPSLTGSDRARAWLESERPNLIACIDEAAREQRHDRVVGLTAALATHLRDEGAWAHALDRHSDAVASARGLGDRLAEATAITDLGVIRRLTGDYQEAAGDLGRALDIYRDLGDQPGEANALYHLGTTLRMTGRYAAATERLETSLGLFRALGNLPGQADVLTEIGAIEELTGDYPGAVQTLRRALDIYRGLADRRGQAKAMYHLAAVLQLTADYQAASVTLGESLGISRGLGDRLGEARALHMRGNLRYSMAQYADATADLERALALYSDLSQRSGQANALCTLGIVRYLTGDYPQAAAALWRSLEICRAMGYRLGEANARCILGIVETRTGDHRDAAASFGDALRIYRDMGDRLGEANVLNEHGDLLRVMADYPQATEMLDQALAIYRELGQPAGEAEALNHVGALWLDRGDLVRARGSYQRALELAGTAGLTIDHARALEGIGRCDVAAGAAGEGHAALRRALEIYRRIGAAEAEGLEEELGAAPGNGG
jgi:tetratricopeptide (TPR) repeat protein/transcriptional regulator with XRE-family HTH domain